MIPRRAQSPLPEISAFHITTLFALAVAHPLYSVLGHADHAPFFIARQSKAIDVWLFVFGVSFGLPAAVYLVLRIVRRLSPKFARGLYALFVSVSFAAIFLPIPEKLGAAAGNWAIAISLLTAAIITRLYLRTAWTRRFVGFMSIIAILSPAMFLNSASIRPLLSTAEAGDYQILSRASDHPDIVLIVFDELPLISLLDEERAIDAVRYPNFHRLAEKSTWYRNATTVHFATADAIASLLTGAYFENYLTRTHGLDAARSGPIDRARVPGNLFSLLESDYEIFATELMTQLAREPEDASEYLPPLSARAHELAIDAAILYAHIVTPMRFRRFLPLVEGQWRGFLSAETSPPSSPKWPFADSHGRLSRVKQLIDRLQKRNEPAFYFLHSLLPHYPFVFNERGQLHANRFRFLSMHFREATGTNDWPDETAANLAYQAHLLQLSFTDLLLGSILDRLAERDLFDDSLLIVTSDHGTNFYWDSTGLPSDELAAIQASESLYVPLLIKLPGQTAGRISDSPVQTIDILPALAEILGLEIPWETDGISDLDAAPPTRTRTARLPEIVRVEDARRGYERALERKIDLFGTHSLDRIYRMGPHPELLGTSVASYPLRDSKAAVRLSHPERYRAGVDPTDPRLPAYVEGEIENLPADFEASGASGSSSLETARWRRFDELTRGRRRLLPRARATGRSRSRGKRADRPWHRGRRTGSPLRAARFDPAMNLRPGRDR
jgi:hypothetical protein